ncbi:ankyrin repeat domain-containing protein [Legionella fairfieldensis]|uniref:ankyrin repeat domain-containing protein n=1 Tax=Legionella fairfieldensis TaxID=45064 RepID=UPI000491EBB9|nr:ankyrin repeat domain-containing protein [Legionella fairfieldensis]
MNEGLLKAAISAIENKDYEALYQVLSEEDLDINSFVPGKIPTLLFYAIEKEDSKLVEVFLEMGANPNIQFHWFFKENDEARKTSPLMLAVEKQNIDIVKILLSDPRTRDFTSKRGPLSIAANLGNKEIVEVLLENGSNLGYRRAGSRKKLSEIAMENGHKELGALLRTHEVLSLKSQLINKMNRDTVDKKFLSDFFTPEREKEISHLNQDIIDLLEQKKNREAIRHDEDGALMVKAIKNGDSSALVKLFNDGAVYTDKVGDFEMSGFFMAAIEGNFEIVKMLAEEGASLTVTDKVGLTAAQTARKNGHEEIASWLDELKIKQTAIFKSHLEELQADAHVNSKHFR